MSIKLFEVDVTDKALPQGSDSAQATLDQVLARAINYDLADSPGEYSPFTASGYLANLNWRDEDIVESNAVGGRNFAGQIKNASTVYDQSGFKTRISALDNVAAFLDSTVIVGTSATYNIHATHHVNSATVGITKPATVAVKDIVYIDGSITPQYRIIALSESGSHYTATLSDSLKQSVNNSNDIVVFTPVQKQISQLLYEALLTVIPDTNKFGSSFSDFNTLDSGKTVTAYYSIADGVMYREYINLLLTLGAFTIKISDSGIIDIERNRNWDQTTISDQFTPDEIMAPYQISFDNTATFYAFQVPHLQTDSVTGDLQVNTSEFQYDPVGTIVSAYKNKAVFSPLPISSGDVAQYNIIFSDATSADYFITVYKDQYTYPRVTVQASAKAFPTGQPAKPFEVSIGQRFLVSIPLAINDNFVQEPAVVTAYAVQRDTQLLQSVTLMLTNQIYPNYTRTIETEPTITSATGVGSSVLRITSTEGTFTVQVRHKYTKEIIFSQKRFCPGDFTINAPLGSYQVRLISNSRIWRTDWEDFTLS
jgi:hypothetical protein